MIQLLKKIVDLDHNPDHHQNIMEFKLGQDTPLVKIP